MGSSRRHEESPPVDWKHLPHVIPSYMPIVVGSNNNKSDSSMMMNDNSDAASLRSGISLRSNRSNASSKATASVQILPSRQSLTDENNSVTSISVPSSYRTGRSGSSRQRKQQRDSRRESPNNSYAKGTTAGYCGDSRSGRVSNRGGDSITERSTSHSTTIRRPSQFRNSTVEQELTINKLRFTPDVLYGRSQEQAVLQNCLKDMQKKKRKQLVLIRGESGVGKSSLALSTLKESLPPKSVKSSTLLVHGKFEEYLKDEPYAGIAVACRHICGEILQLQRGNQKELFETIQKALKQELGRDEMPFLVRILPELVEIMNTASSTPKQPQRKLSGNSSSSESDDVYYDIDAALQRDAAEGVQHQGNQHRFNNAFRIFFRVAGTHFFPVIVVLDNLHWADQASLDLIQVLITDRENHNLYLMCCSRTESANEDERPNKGGIATRIQRVAKLADEWNRESRDFNFDMTDMFIGNLAEEDIHAMLADLLSADHQSLAGLAKICHQKTLGHVFFLIEYLKDLHERGLLTYNLGMLKWVWDEYRIVSQTMVADNVVDMMVEKMKLLPPAVVQILQLAALLGSQFDESTLEMVWKGVSAEIAGGEESKTEEQSDVCDDGVVAESLITAMAEGLLEALPNNDSTGYNKYQWTHDNIMEAAFSMIHDHEVEKLMYYVGDTLASNLNPHDLERSIFVVVNLLNEGKDSVGLGETIYYSSKRIRMAELNLLAAKRAVLLSAFHSAVSYTQYGIKLLPFDRWECHFDLTLELYSIAAETEAFVGETEMMNRHCSEVVERPECSLWDKLRVFNVLVDSIAHQGNPRDACDLCRDLLKEMGCKFPQGKIATNIAISSALRKIKSITEKLSDESISSLDELIDPRRIECMRLLDRLFTYSFYSDRRCFPLYVFRSLQWTLEHGICYLTPPTFATTAVVLTGIHGDFALGSKLAEQALRLTERLVSTGADARTIYISHSYVLNWTRPCRSLLEPLFNGYSKGLKTGDTESAMYNIFYYLLLSFQSGKPLKAVEADCNLYCTQMIDLKRLKIVFMAKILWQTILNLMGESENTTLLMGRELEYDVAYTFAESMQNTNGVALLEFFQLFVYTFFGDHEKGAELALKKGDSLQAMIPGSPTVQMDNLCRGISLFDMARKTQKKKYKQEAMKVLATVKGHVKKGALNVYHHEALLEGELAALHGDSEVARHHYGRATVLAGRRGFLQDSALANERFGAYLLKDLSDTEEATYRLEQAAKLYREWGARAKADLVTEEFGHLWASREENQSHSDE
ncbi:PAS sensor protein [Nitzschia inconspicua]|uniref:PAS sensor protein n=1 Tax=Nitzschia inconspicua TaxID=303405 RepID=A0A9K3PE45_9STRA|nr:PAS sensor protein [Nitzschia inconspicua]KAG7362933.1 PAS sensor protein [Nitzschia inconspicua]